MNIAERTARDQSNAKRAVDAARKKLEEPLVPIPYVAGAKNVSKVQAGSVESRRSLQTIAGHPFDAVVQLRVTNKNGQETTQLWYANRKTSTNEPVDGVLIKTWTDPAIAVALSHRLEQRHRLPTGEYSTVAVVPISRGLFTNVLPMIAAIYEPLEQPDSVDDGIDANGSVDARTVTESIEVAAPAPASTNLRSVKIGMTAEQVDVFISQPRGYLLVEGAPGTGKTTIALQRIRFLLDEFLRSESMDLSHTSGTSAVFVPASAFVNYVGNLLSQELDLPPTLVIVVDDYIEKYLDTKWAIKLGATLAKAADSSREQRGRSAYFGLGSADDLRHMWATYEQQIAHRLMTAASAERASWYRSFQGGDDDKIETALNRLVAALAEEVSFSEDPHESHWRMDALFERVRRPYRDCRLLIERGFGALRRDQFDRAFRGWLFWVYDPLHAMSTFFLEHGGEGLARVEAGLGDAGVAPDVTAALEAQLSTVLDAEDQLRELASRRRYFSESRAWIAWLLRHALPEVAEATERFMLIPRAFFNSRVSTQYNDASTLWHHVVIDEAQDLAPPAAALIASLVHPRGALTVSADFRQAVSSVSGMKDDEAISYGSAMKTEPVHFRFQMNLRQTRENGRFVAAFYKGAFGQTAPFVPATVPGTVPTLILAPSDAQFELALSEAVRISVAKGLRTLAVIDINGTTESTDALRSSLAELEPIRFSEYYTSQVTVDAVRIIVATAEEVKGFEFDGCIIVGLEAVEFSPLNVSKNRAYVAISRAMKQLTLICREMPRLLQRIDPTTFVISDDSSHVVT